MSENTKQKGKSPFADILPMIIGEAIVAGLVCLGFLIVHLLGYFDIAEYYKVPLGALLGSVVIIANHVWLVLSVDKQIKKFIDNRPSGEMSDEDIELYAKKQSTSIQNAMRVSFMIRTVSVMLTLIIAFLVDWFNPIATAIPMFAFRFILSVVDKLMKRHEKAPDPAKFIKYDFEDENKDDIKEEKEDK